MDLIVNGEPHKHRGDGTLLSLLSEISADPLRVAVMINDNVVSRTDRDSVALADGDRIEIVVFAGGGSF